jgi:hypothetical protein
MIGRRDFITLVGGVAAWPLAAPAQQTERIPRVGALIPYAGTDPEAQAQMAVFRDALDKLGLAPGRIVQLDERWTAGDFGMLRRAARDLVAMRPDSLSAAALPLLLLSFTRRAHDQSYSCSFQIQWAMASSSAWLALLVMLLALPTFQLPWPENGWSCSRRWCRASAALQ